MKKNSASAATGLQMVNDLSFRRFSGRFMTCVGFNLASALKSGPFIFTPCHILQIATLQCGSKGELAVC